MTKGPSVTYVAYEKCIRMVPIEKEQFGDGEVIRPKLRTLLFT
jgi:hypothetical protein